MPKKPPPQAEPKPDLVVEYEGAPPKLFVIRDPSREMWWRPNRAGYTSELTQAGTYTERETKEIIAGADGDFAVTLDEAVKQLGAVNPVVLAVLAARGSR